MPAKEKKNECLILYRLNLENGLEAADKLKGEGFNEAEAIQIDVSNSEPVKAGLCQKYCKTKVAYLK